jgi:hypothetical protein
LWTIVAIASIVWRAIGSIQIMWINNARLPEGFKVGKVNTVLLWFSAASGILAVGAWFIVVFPSEACKQAGLFC